MTLEKNPYDEELLPKDLESPFQKLVGELAGKAERWEVIEIKGRRPLYNFYNSRGMDVRQFLDPDHMPGITEFTTVVVSEEFAGLRGENATLNKKGRLVEVDSDPVFVAMLSYVASDKDNYGDSEKAKTMRRLYRRAAACALSYVHAAFPIGKNDLLVGVKRCGSNILDELKNMGDLEDAERVDVSAKRLRFLGLSGVLGAGVSLASEEIAVFSERDVRLQEGVVAAGTTEAVFMAEIRNKGIKVAGLSCDAAVICPAGAALVYDLRGVLGIRGEDRTSNACGYLDENWYVRYGLRDRLSQRLREFPQIGVTDFIGKQVLGDGGDLTSNV